MLSALDMQSDHFVSQTRNTASLLQWLYKLYPGVGKLALILETFLKANMGLQCNETCMSLFIKKKKKVRASGNTYCEKHCNRTSLATSCYTVESVETQV